MKKLWKYVLSIGLGVTAAWYLGAMVNFLPFMGDELIYAEIGFCTLIICVVLAVCTGLIVDAVRQTKKETESEETSKKTETEHE